MEEKTESTKEEIFEKVSFKTSWAPDASFYKEALRFAVKCDSSNYGYYSSVELMDGENFGFLWNEHPGLRIGMLDSMIKNRTKSGQFEAGDREDILGNIYDQIPSDSEENSNQIRAYIAKNKESNCDFLTEISRHGLVDGTNGPYQSWREAGMSASTSSAFFDYLWGRVKRGRGAVIERNDIIEAASQRNAISDHILKHVAKRGTKTMKRTMVYQLSEKKNRLEHPFGRWKDMTNLSKEEEQIFSLNKESIAKLENKLMLFVDCDDQEVVGYLIRSLSRENLPWLMPSASKHPWLSRTLSEKIESKGN